MVGQIVRLALPEEGYRAWAVSADDPTGMETPLRLAREEPLPPEKDAELRELLGGLPVPKEQNLQAAAWFENGRITPLHNLRGATRGTTRGTRGFDSFDPKQADDPVMETQRLLQEKLGRMFDYTRAVSYAHSQ